MTFQNVREYVVRIPNFSDEEIHAPGSSAPAEVEDSARPRDLVRVFANGADASEAGHVSLTLKTCLLLADDVSCVVSVSDASGRRRFPRSYVFCEREVTAASGDAFPTLAMGRFARRDALLADKDELLPRDCLTLHLQVTETLSACTSLDAMDDAGEDPSASFEVPPAGDVRLPLDSSLARRLVAASPYFRGLSEAPMLERRRGYAAFPRRELAPLLVACDVLCGKRFVLVESLDHLLESYAVADKYDVPPAAEGCRRMLALLLRDPATREQLAGERPRLLEVAEARGDGRLRELLEGGGGEAEWRLEHVAGPCSDFTFSRVAQRREDDFGFYQ